MAELTERPMDEIKALFLERLNTRFAVDPIDVIDAVSTEHAISHYDLKAALWYLVGDGSVRFDPRRSVVRVAPAGAPAGDRDSEGTLRP